MKKFIALILATIYITASSGVVLNVHYCMGKVSSVKVDNFKNTFCKCGKKQEGSSCCRSEVKVVKLSSDHKATLPSPGTKLPVATLPSTVSNSNFARATSPIIRESLADAPPIISSDKIYIRNRVFRI